MEVASIHAAELVKTLLSVIALTNMHRATRDDEYRKSAAAWIPTLTSQMSALARELEKSDATPS